jgi:PKD repeat protein
MNKFIKYVKLLLMFNISIFFLGCEDKNDDASKVTAGFTYTINEETGTVTFVNTSVNATEYLWDLGNDETSTETSPVYTYVPGTYFVKLTASNAGGSKVFTDTLFYGGLVANGNFETGTTEGWILFQNGGSAELDNTINNGGEWTGRLVTGGPSNPAFKQERIGTGVVMSGDVVQIKFDYKGAVVQPGAIFNVVLFGERVAPGASFTHVFSPAPVPGSNWATFTGTFKIGNGTDVSQGISVLIEAVCGGDAGCSVSANIDNLTVTLNP